AWIAELEWADAPLLAAQHVEADVRCDAIEPGPEGGAAFEAVEPAPRAHHRLLHGVLGVEGRAEHPVAVARQLPAVALELSLELRCPCRGAHPMSFWTAQGLMGVIVNSKEANNMSDTTDARTRWLALYVLCLASLMIVLDVTIVGVALPSIREDLGFSETSLAWVVNGYLLTYGGFLLLG